ncbi:MAG TPA: hypothetical protein VK501_11940 [Baekduia sp.]|uniref:hypothetical protein n=1 Tax=Baekduia sp. TaxID=2600305 RepID=UPI002BE27391|nr:hypothetical protein [Baekduia sp.]HMJ34620.1 hypothetical protein [Baekduia sp.]
MLRLSPDAERRVVTLVPPLLVGLLALPFVLRQNAWWEWTTAFWLLERQTEHVSAHGLPTFYLHTDSGTFYAFNVFYAGFTVSVLAYPAAVLGAWPVFATTCAGALVAGYLGIWWTARNLGLSRRLAILPGLAFATTPYLLTDLYGRASWAELVAVNGTAVMLGGLTALLCHPERGRGRALLALAGSGAIVAGTHNLTMLMTAIALPLVVAALLPLVRGDGGAVVVARRLGRGVAAIAVGVGLTGAWLVPNLWLGPDTYIARSEVVERLIRSTAGLARTSSVLSPWPTPAPGMWLYCQPPVFVMAWAVVALLVVVGLRRRPVRFTASAAALLALGAGLLVLIVHPLWWLHLPRVLQAVQSPVRVIPYLSIVVAMALVVVLTAIAHGPARRLLVGTLLMAVSAQVALGVTIAIGTQASSWTPTVLQRHGDVRADGEPLAFALPEVMPWAQFRTVGRPTGAKAAKDTETVEAGVRSRTTSDAGTLRGRGAVGDHRETSIVWSPLVRVAGDARITGRTSNGTAVVTLTHTDGAGRWSATARPRCTLTCLNALSGDAPWPLLAGRLLTLLSAGVLMAAAAMEIRRRRRGRGRAPTVPTRPEIERPVHRRDPAAERPEPAVRLHAE